MSMKNPYEKYQTNTIFTAPKEDLTLMLYEGALKFSNQAVQALEMRDLEKTHNLILRVQAIIREFQLTLNPDIEISGNFASIYEYIYNLLIDANVQKDIEKLKEARDLIRDFRDMWREAIQVAKTTENIKDA